MYILDLQPISRDTRDNVSHPRWLVPTIELITYSFVLHHQHGRRASQELLPTGKAFISTTELFVFFWHAVSRILDKSLLNFPCSISEFCFPGYPNLPLNREV